VQPRAAVDHLRGNEPPSGAGWQECSRRVLVFGASRALSDCLGRTPASRWQGSTPFGFYAFQMFHTARETKVNCNSKGGHF
jgi:hypothetical protein